MNTKETKEHLKQALNAANCVIDEIDEDKHKQFERADKFEALSQRLTAENKRITAENKKLKDELKKSKHQEQYTLARFEEVQDDREQLHAELEKHRWIPVSERLPEKTGEYLILPYQKHSPILWYQGGWFWYNHRDDCISETIGYEEELIRKVTHWKPILPEQSSKG